MVTLELTPAVWGVTLLLILGLFAFDLIYSTRRPHAVRFKEAVIWSVFYIAVALLFGVAFTVYAGGEFGAQYFAGYIVEKSLSVDNLFVFVIIISAFAVPKEHQQKLLTIGILLALVFRAIFIAVGAALLSLFSFVFLLFGLLLIWTAIKLYQHRDEDPEINDNALVRGVRRVVPISDHFDGGRFTTRIRGRRVATPMFLAFIAIGSTDILFALDSIPAVYGVTAEPYIVFVANAFALLGLRALYFLVSGLLDRLIYLSTGLAVILGFIGIKLVLHWAHGIWPEVPQISTPFSLAVIGVVLVITTVASIIVGRREPERVAHAGSLRQGEDEEEPR